MTYTVVRTAENNFELRDINGNTLASYSKPLELPGDVIDDILDDVGVTDPAIRSAIKIAATGSIGVKDQR